MNDPIPDGAVLALSGGVGGAKLALGLHHLLPPGQLLVACNTGDDFTHLGLHVSPDLDTVMYTLAGLNNEDLGWGLRGESWNFMDALARLGGPGWFRLGDQDLATHVERTTRLSAGQSLSAVTDQLRRRLAIASELLPMTDDRVRTRVGTPQGWLDFQDYFVRLRCEPRVVELVFDGAAEAAPNPRILAALASPGLRAVVICPSNPFISIEPMLALPGLRQALAATQAPVVAVTPVIGNRAVKGPTAKIMAELGLPASPATAASRYAGLLDAFITDLADPAEPPSTHRAATLMTTLDSKILLARVVLGVADGVRSEGEASGSLLEKRTKKLLFD